MLVTDTSWAESHPVRGGGAGPPPAGPYQAWRCVGWTDEALNFLIVASGRMRDRDQLPDGWLVGGPEALLEAASQLEAGAFAVYVLDRAVDAAKVDLCQVTGIWRERDGAVPIFLVRYDRGRVETLFLCPALSESAAGTGQRADHWRGWRLRAGEPVTALAHSCVVAQ
jgi:hypothetical protein